MLIATLVSALSASAVAPGPWTCDLAPSVGQGISDEGRIDGITAINFGCRYQAFRWRGLEVSPSFGVGKQLWSLYQTRNAQKNISTYDIQDFWYGLRLEKMAWPEAPVTVFYAIAAAQGKGSLDRTVSSQQSSLSSSYSNVAHSHIVHSLGASYGITSNLSLTLAWQRQDARQNWEAGSGDILLQTVGDDTSLALSEGQTALLGTSERTSSRHMSNHFQLGLSFNFAGY